VTVAQGEATVEAPVLSNDRKTAILVAKRPLAMAKGVWQGLAQVPDALPIGFAIAKPGWQAKATSTVQGCA